MHRRFEVNHAAVAGAAALLGIQRPVKVAPRPMKRRSGRYCWGGKFDLDLPMQDLPHHRITVNRTLSPEAATRVVWHELGHALQAERHPTMRAFGLAYGRALQEVGLNISDADLRTLDQDAYSRSRFEREADMIKAEYANIPLTDPTNGE